MSLGQDMNYGKIRVGIIGAGGWAKYGHIPALQALKDEYEIVAVASRKKEQAEEYKAKFTLLHAFDNLQPCREDTSGLSTLPIS